MAYAQWLTLSPDKNKYILLLKLHQFQYWHNVSCYLPQIKSGFFKFVSYLKWNSEVSSLWVILME